MEIQDFARWRYRTDLASEYEAKSDEELLRLALESVELTPEANVALSAELSRRKINTREQLDEFQVQEQRRRKKEEEKNLGRYGCFTPTESDGRDLVRQDTTTAQKRASSGSAPRYSLYCSGSPDTDSDTSHRKKASISAIGHSARAVRS